MKQIDRENLRAWATHGSMSSAFAPTVCAWVTDAIEHIEKLEAQVALLGAALKRDGVLVELAGSLALFVLAAIASAGALWFVEGIRDPAVQEAA